MAKVLDSAMPAGPTPNDSDRVHLMVSQKVARAFVGKKPGQQVRLIVIGEITAVSLREPFDDVKEQYIGDVDLEVTTLKVFDMKSDIAEMMDDDE